MGIGLDLLNEPDFRDVQRERRNLLVAKGGALVVLLFLAGYYLTL
jgi:hypothetical protein